MNQDYNSHNEITPKSINNPTISPIKAATFGLIAVFILYQFGGAILTLLIFGLDFEKADVNAMRLLTMGGQILFILLPALILSKGVYEDVTKVIRANKPQLKDFGYAILGLVILIPFLQSMLNIQVYILDKLADNFSLFNSFKLFFDELNKLVDASYGNLLSAGNVFEYAIVILVIAVTPAVCEEVFFRGFAQKSYELKLKPWGAILITSLVFGLYHFNPYGLVALIALGMYFGFVAYKTESIFVVMVLHFLNNFFSIILYWFFGEDDFSTTSFDPPEEIFTDLTVFIILGILFTAYLVFFDKNYSNKISEVENDMSNL